MWLPPFMRAIGAVSAERMNTGRAGALPPGLASWRTGYGPRRHNVKGSRARAGSRTHHGSGCTGAGVDPDGAAVLVRRECALWV